MKHESTDPPIRGDESARRLRACRALDALKTDEVRSDLFQILIIRDLHPSPG